MAKYELDDTDTTGYFLPEDTHFRLQKLQEHMEFLSQLAQPRTHDEEARNRGPVISGMDLAICMEILAEQAEQVLDEVSFPATREVEGTRPATLDDYDDDDDDDDDLDDADGDPAGVEEAREVLAAGAQDDDGVGKSPASKSQDDVAHGKGEASAVADADSDADADATADRLVIGMTTDQLDTLNRLHDRLHAYGDMVLGLERMTLADGTPTVLGEVIFEDAEAAGKLMDQVAEQRLPDELRGTRRVREAHAVYGVPGSPGPTFDAAMPRLPPPVPAGFHPPGASLH